MGKVIILFALFGLSCLLSVQADKTDNKIYRMCVPQVYYQDCLNLLKDPSEAGIQMECVAGRDRIDCLDLIGQRKADILASEPEDMYVAYHMKNQDYRVISEIRTKDDKDANFRYEGVILVKKNSKFHNLKDLRGAKSCHTGFGRNVGYRIPITKLKNSHVLTVTMDPEITATERELKALSEFFTKSCLVGTYSPYPETDKILKKKYSNLCALCEHPEQCNYPDKFSGYDGAIRCLDKGQGEVAFTKTQYIKKYFGMVPGVEAEGNPAQFEYLCEDGSRRPLTGPACSWAQRPWMGYISNADVVQNPESFHNIQNRLEKFFLNGLHAQNKASAAHLLINENAVFHEKAEAVEPKTYLEKAGYKDVIERDGSMIRKMKFCVQTEIESKKCENLRRAAYSRDVRPEIECVQESDCVEAVKSGKADITVVKARDYKDARKEKLIPVIYEDFADDDVYVAVVEPSLNKESIQKSPVFFDDKNERARLAAAYLNNLRNVDKCQNSGGSDASIRIIHAKELENHKNKQLLCPDMEKKPVTEMRTCNMEANLPKAIFIRDSMTNVEKLTLQHLFISMSTKFGKDSKTPDVFALFGAYHKDAHNVIFDDNAVAFVIDIKEPQINEETYNKLTCEANHIKTN